GLLGGGDRVSAVVVVDENVGTAIGNVQHPGAEIGGTQRVNLRVVDRGPPLLFGELLHVVVDRVPVVVVGNQVNGLDVLAVFLRKNVRNGRGSGVAVLEQTEAVVAVVFTCCVTVVTDVREFELLVTFLRTL